MPTRTVAETLEAFGLALDELTRVDPFSLSDPDSVVALERASARLAYVTTKAVGAFEAGGEWAVVGAKSAGAWLDTRCRLPKGESRRQLVRAKALPHLEVAAGAFGAGEIGAAQFDALAAARTDVTEEAFARDEAMLVGFAKELKYRALCTALTHWTQRADPEGAEESELAKRNRRDVYLAQSLDGMYLGAMTLDPVSGATVANELGRLEDQLFEADWAEAKARLGRDPKVHELERNFAQRRADALVEMAIRSAALPEGARRPSPHITFVVGYEALYGAICRIQDGPVVSLGTILGQLDGATFERIVFGPKARAEVSVTSRFFLGATRRAIEVRDQECTHEFCDLAAQYCQIDHIVPWSTREETTQDNGRVLCGFHNRLRNHHEPEPESGEHGPEPGEHGPEPDEHGPEPDEHGPEPDEHGPEPGG